MHQEVPDELGGGRSIGARRSWTLPRKRGSLTGSNPVDQTDTGGEIHVLTEAEGLSLLVVSVSVANTADIEAFKPLYMAILPIRSRHRPGHQRVGKGPHRHAGLSKCPADPHTQGGPLRRVVAAPIPPRPDTNLLGRLEVLCPAPPPVSCIRELILSCPCIDAQHARSVVGTMPWPRRLSRLSRT